MWHQRPDTLFVAPQQLRFWQDIWRTDTVRELFHSPAYALVRERVLALPWWWVTPRHPHEHRHFSVWFGQTILRRHYAQPAVEDLYLLHDLLHAVTLEAAPESTFTTWQRQMRVNEIAVSLETEVLVYARCPQLRPQTFDFPIWADRFDLQPGQRQFMASRTERWWGERALLRPNPAQQVETALFEARPYGQTWPLPFPGSASFGQPEDLWAARRAVTLWPGDGASEQTIHRYEHAVARFYEAWQDTWQLVEAERQRFAYQIATGQWMQARRERELHWEAHSDDRGVPYGCIAERLRQDSNQPTSTEADLILSR